MKVEDEVRTFVETNFYVGDRKLGAGESLLDTGVMDSTGVLELIAFLEDTYGIRVEDEEVVPENLDSIARAAAFVRRKRAQVRTG